MFEKILIANRGEIACRIARTCRRMGIRTVAVYSEADAEAPHVRMADEAVAIGPAASSQSYLRAERIIAAAQKTGAEAVHPGFGFLSEKAEFVAALEAAKLTFIGPPGSAIAAMGDKIASKKLAAEAGVSTVPGHEEAVADGEEAVAIAARLGYPVMLKASAGGGGKGMRIATSEAEVRDGLRAARNEARASFGDDRVLIEKFIEEPRHIEIQILADGKGRTLYLGERECSIQRRHQKVIEEAPSPFLDSETRRRMGEQAVSLAQAVGYASAGTVEFIVDRAKNFYFLEMNTRLQVEHPVTEMVTGLDLVEWMIRIAAGESLPWRQEDLRLDGWAVEARIYAEDPTRGFLPSVGRLVRYSEPPRGASVRVDSGVVEGSEISIHYDPMIAKLAAHGPDRQAAIRELSAALDAFYIRGINHNMSFLSAVLASERFRAGRLSTGFIAEEFPDGFHGRAPTAADRAKLVAVAALLQRRRELSGGSAPRRAPYEQVVLLDGEPHLVTLSPEGEALRVAGNGEELLIEGDWRPGDPLFRGTLEGEAVTVQVDGAGAAFRLAHDGALVTALTLRPRVAELARLMPVKAPPDLSKFLLSPMPGLLVSLAVEVNQDVKAGEELAIIEAMKMENVLRAAADGRVAAILAKPGESLAVDQAILEFA